MNDQQPGWLRRNGWPLVAIVVAVAAVAATYHVYALQQATSALSVKQLSVSSLVEVDPSAEGQVRIFLGEREVRDAVVAVYSFGNVGRRPIRSADFEGPVTLTFPESSTILQPPMMQSSTLDASDVKVGVEGNALRVMPLLLNPGDTFSIQVIVIDTPQDGFSAALHARIAGVPSVPSQIASSADSQPATIPPWGYLVPLSAGFVTGVAVSGVMRVRRTPEVEALHRRLDRMVAQAEADRLRHAQES